MQQGLDDPHWGPTNRITDFSPKGIHRLQIQFFPGVASWAHPDMRARFLHLICGAAHRVRDADAPLCAEATLSCTYRLRLPAAYVIRRLVERRGVRYRIHGLHRYIRVETFTFRASQQTLTGTYVITPPSAHTGHRR